MATSTKKETIKLLPEVWEETNIYCKQYLQGKKAEQKGKATKDDAGSVLVASFNAVGGSYETNKYAFAIIPEKDGKTYTAQWDKIQELYPAVFAELVEKKLIVIKDSHTKAFARDVREI